jgi:hypothetical protein
MTYAFNQTQMCCKIHFRSLMVQSFKWRHCYCDFFSAVSYISCNASSQTSLEDNSEMNNLSKVLNKFSRNLDRAGCVLNNYHQLIVKQ